MQNKLLIHECYLLQGAETNHIIPPVSECGFSYIFHIVHLIPLSEVRICEACSAALPLGVGGKALRDAARRV